jgi:hypothetical protein
MPRRPLHSSETTLCPIRCTTYRKSFSCGDWEADPCLSTGRARRNQCNRCQTGKPRSLDHRFSESARQPPESRPPQGRPSSFVGRGGPPPGGKGGGRPPPPHIDPSVGDWQVRGAACVWSGRSCCATAVRALLLTRDVAASQPLGSRHVVRCFTVPRSAHHRHARIGTGRGAASVTSAGRRTLLVRHPHRPRRTSASTSPSAWTRRRDTAPQGATRSAQARQAGSGMRQPDGSACGGRGPRAARARRASSLTAAVKASRRHALRDALDASASWSSTLPRHPSPACRERAYSRPATVAPCGWVPSGSLTRRRMTGGSGARTRRPRRRRSARPRRRSATSARCALPLSASMESPSPPLTHALT